MGKIKVHEFMTLDGVVENPAWTMEFGFDPKMGEAIAGLMGGDDNAILLGRTTFEMFAPAWSTRTAEEDPGAPFFNDSTKYVVGGATPSVEWANSVMLGAYDPAAIQQVKADVAGTIYVSGSAALVRGMLQDGLVDELHLFVYPVTLGSGLRLFTDGTPGHTLVLLESETYANGVVHLAYAPKV
ncbi:MAG TPA: dihydrofolate reductase family protein [Frankiaceae bacterium]|jgi:dihydrofolate reductase|nr:dihydrofolate reductase family protein [Frankiaceae bacterium]